MTTRNLVLSLALLSACTTPLGNQVPPEVAAKKFASTLQLDVQGDPICTRIDSDLDGYVSCTLALKNHDGPPKMMSLQCAAMGAGGGCNGRPADGCKETSLQVPRQGS